MNWEALSGIAEAVGALGVIVSLLYLASQVRQGNKDASAQALQGLGHEYSSHSAIVTSDEYADAFIKGLSSYYSLSPQEKLKFDYCLAGYINLAEHAMAHTDAGRASDVMAMYETYVSRRIFPYPGVREWWEHGDKSGFGKSTQDWVDEQIEKNRGKEQFWHVNAP